MSRSNRFGLLYLWLALLVLLLTAGAARAADAPLLSWERCSLALQGGGAWYSGGADGFTPAHASDLVLAAVSAYSLGTAVAVLAPVRLGCNSGVLSFEPGLALALNPGAATRVGLEAGYRWAEDTGDGGDVAEKAEGYVGASIVKPLARGFALAFPARYGLTSQQTRIEAKLSWLAGGK